MEKREKLDFSGPIYKTGSRFLVNGYEGDDSIIEVRVIERKNNFIRLQVSSDASGYRSHYSKWYDTSYDYPTFYLLEKLD